jgi:hypothetical protein
VSALVFVPLYNFLVLHNLASIDLDEQSGITRYLNKIRNRTSSKKVHGSNVIEKPIASISRNRSEVRLETVRKAPPPASGALSALSASVSANDLRLIKHEGMSQAAPSSLQPLAWGSSTTTSAWNQSRKLVWTYAFPDNMTIELDQIPFDQAPAIGAEYIAWDRCCHVASIDIPLESVLKDLVMLQRRD